MSGAVHRTPMLGLATNEELLGELICRFEIPLADHPMAGVAAAELKQMCDYLEKETLRYWTADPGNP